MATLLEVQAAQKRYGEQLLLDNASVALPDGCKIGMVGRNGAGKSTLCRALVGSEELDAGEVVRHPRLRLGYLRQHDPFEPGETVLEFLLRDSGQPDWRCGEVAAEFALKGDDLARPIAEFSGGWQTRIKLAALLLHEPNLLLLDEPTNFLDLRTQVLLEHFLKHFAGATLIVSHDRGFLKATCTHTLELARGKLTLFPNDIERYLEFKEERRQHNERVNAATLAKRKQLETFINKNRANANTASQARSKKKQLERLELIDIEGEERAVKFHLPQSDIRQGTAVRCRDLAIGYPDHTVAGDINLEIEHGSCTVLVGDNGQGKTTMLRTLVGSLEPVAGEFRWGYGCDIGVYAQHVYTSLPEDETIFDYLDRCRSPETSQQKVLDIAGSFLFHGDLVKKRIQVLSGGERARLCLAGLLLAPHNVLVLDEPGNHLDVETVDALAEAIQAYEGTIILTSHDRHFVRRVAGGVIEIRDGRATHYGGGYEAYLYCIEQEYDALAATLAPPRDPERRGKSSGGKSQAKSERSLQKQIQSLERKIAKLDERRRELNEALMATTDAAEAQRLHEELTTMSDECAAIEEQWLELQE
ncbi:MAG: ABC transporter ATP-binding protein [Planctomycetota bacterium]|nr:MAG: ABC transporter ATP-binding protein [Planctomycetota bacterium]REK40776.1 MAG: ABC transporter ATP-binding protein [Planctomycetota bacterium]